MSIAAPAARPARSANGPPASLVLAGLGAAVVVRLVVAGGAGARSAPAGLAFAGVLLAVAYAAGWRPGRRGRLSIHSAVAGLAGAAALCLAPLVAHLARPGPALDPRLFAGWAFVVGCVAAAEEILLRGALYGAVARAHSDLAALAVTTVAFAALHVPFYGVGSVPVNLAAGVLLGGLRQWTGGVLAPGLAHTLADLTGWWLR